MPKIDIARAANAAILAARHGASSPAPSPTALIVGGTAGIGQALAYKLAQYTHSPHIVISARDPLKAQTTLKQLEVINSRGKYEFLASDMSLMTNVRQLSNTFLEKTPVLNYLIVSSGALSMAGRTETEDGIDRKLAFHYYGRFLLLNLLAPALERAATQGQEARALSVLAATSGGKIRFDDLDLKKEYSLKLAAEAASGYNDLMVEELSIRHPTVSWSHAYPGFVATGSTEVLPWGARHAVRLLAATLAIKSEDSGDYLLNGFATNNDRAKGWFLLNQFGDAVPKAKYHTNDARRLVWDHSAELVKL